MFGYGLLIVPRNCDDVAYEFHMGFHHIGPKSVMSNDTLQRWTNVQSQQFNAVHLTGDIAELPSWNAFVLSKDLHIVIY